MRSLFLAVALLVCGVVQGQNLIYTGTANDAVFIPNSTGANTFVQLDVGNTDWNIGPLTSNTTHVATPTLVANFDQSFVPPSPGPTSYNVYIGNFSPAQQSFEHFAAHGFLLAKATLTGVELETTFYQNVPAGSGRVVTVFYTVRWYGTISPDYNNNGLVDGADYTVWRDSLGQVVQPYFGADGSGNGVIDQADWQVWHDHWGEASW